MPKRLVEAMAIAYTITPDLRIKLKEPFGTLITGSFDQTASQIKELVSKEKPTKLISVGDVVSKNLHEYGLHPILSIVDNKSLRIQQWPTLQSAEKPIYVKNPQGTITKEAIDSIRIALSGKQHVHIVVDGEEDLLTLIAINYAPNGSFVVYGQPQAGVVLVRVEPEKKSQVKNFLKAMETPRKAK